MAGVFTVSGELVRAQNGTVFAHVRIDAAKIGMLGHAPVIEAVAARACRRKVHGRGVYPFGALRFLAFGSE